MKNKLLYTYMYVIFYTKHCVQKQFSFKYNIIKIKDILFSLI